ncbi:hypothetical protein GGR51DRAFT_497223 [Nemania sp. FL0031]|nr:hypothetical protein GGR51DRAFT_497223 [Nemania sp. FL0031]
MESNRTGPMNYATTSEDGKTPATVITIGAVFSVLPAITVFLRFYCRLHVTRVGLAADDWLMLAAFFLTLGMGIILIVGAALHGLAQPTPQGWGPTDYFWVTDNAEIITEKTFFVFMLVQDIAFGLAKLSVLSLYRRIFSTPTFRALSMALMVIVVAWSVSFFFAYLFRCGTHFWALWAPLMYLLEYCYNSAPMFQALGISDVLTDVLILSLPLFWIWKLKMSTAKRWAVSGVFLLGFVEIGTGLARTIIVIQLNQNYVKAADGIGLLTTTMFWSMIEMGIAVVAGCLPPMWPLISKIPLENMVRTVRRTLSLENLRSFRSTSASQRRQEASGNTKDSGEDFISLDTLPHDVVALNDLGQPRPHHSEI